MFKIMNLSTYNYDIERFQNSGHNICSFLSKHNMDGIELLHPIGWEENIIPKKIIKGVHLKYYPTWLDFWNNNKKALLDQFENEDMIEKYYGGKSRDIMIKHYRNEIKIAQKMGAEYVVFHVAHVQVEHVYNYNFTYSDCEVIDASAELLNNVFEGLNTNIKLLFENLWWPGFTMLKKDMALRLLEKVNYKNKGFMLDTAHLMNTNLYLKDEKQGVQYIIDTINNLGELKNLIKGIHLNCSLSGNYVIDKMNGNKYRELKLNPLSEQVFMHVFNIDKHKPFAGKSVRKLIEFIKPEYLVYELIASSIDELEKYIEIQNAACMN